MYICYIITYIYICVCYHLPSAYPCLSNIMRGDIVENNIWTDDQASFPGCGAAARDSLRDNSSLLEDVLTSTNAMHMLTEGRLDEIIRMNMNNDYIIFIL